MLGFVIILTLILLTVIIVQLSKVSQLAAKIRGEEEVYLQNNNRTAVWLVIFMILFLVFCVVSAYYYKDVMLGYGPHTAASEHGVMLDDIFNVTLIFTGIVFIITQIYLFWFSYKYRERKGVVAKFFPHSTQLEIIWTVIPMIVMTYLVVKGLFVWNAAMADVKPGEEVMEIEAAGYQFAWDLRYPGADGKLGTRDFRLIDLANNPLGQDWKDDKNIDDFLPSEIVLPVNKKVRVRITAKDVLHNFYLPHFRVKMDAVPGLPTYFVFTPTKTTDEYRQTLREYPEWNVPYDETDPEGPLRWEAFNYELACAELCGSGHYSMRREVRIVEQDEYEEWLSQQQSYYLTNIRNTDADPRKGGLLDAEIGKRKMELLTDFESAHGLDDPSGENISLRHVFFETGSSNLKDLSKYELDNLSNIMTKYSTAVIELGGHTDNVGDPAGNQRLSEARASSVRNYLLSKGVSADRMRAVGYGADQPVADNATPEGRQENRRTELRIISK